MRMLVSYWDAGYVQLNVDNPAAPTHITDTNFDDPDPLTGFDPPEGNAHQAEYSHNSDFFLAGDEDFSPDRLATVEITTGPNAGDFDGNSIGGSAPVANLADGVLNGPTVYGGYGCDASAAIPPRDTSGLPPLEPDEEAIVVIQRGPGFVGLPPRTPPTTRRAPRTPASRARRPRTPSTPATTRSCSSTTTAARPAASSAAPAASRQRSSPSAPRTRRITASSCRRRRRRSPTTPPPNPTIGDLGEYVSAEAEFDGWGYGHLYNASTSEEIDAFAIPEALDPDFASGFGDLTIHEIATDPTRTSPTARTTRAGCGCSRSAQHGHQPDRRLHRPGWLELLGHRAVDNRGRRAADRGLRPRLRSADLPLHGPGGVCRRTRNRAQGPPPHPRLHHTPAPDTDPPETEITKEPKRRRRRARRSSSSPPTRRTRRSSASSTRRTSSPATRPTRGRSTSASTSSRCARSTPPETSTRPRPSTAGRWTRRRRRARALKKG